jgi:hypothetical protein
VGTYEPILVMLLSSILVVVVIYRSFIKEEIAFNGISVRPTMLTNRLNLTAGFLVYFFVIMLSFTVITYYWGPLGVIVSPFVKDTPIEPLIGDGTKTPEALVPLVVAGAAAWFLAWDAKYNPFAVILQIARDLIHVPNQAQVTLTQLRAAKFRQLSEDEAKAIARDEDIKQCEAGDFALVRKSLLYRWAHLCHLHYLLLQYLRPGQPVAKRARGAAVINSLGWDALNTSYLALSPQVAAWRTSNTKDPDEAIEIFNQLNDLKEKHYCILACLIASTSGSESEIWSRLQGLSDDPKPIPGNISLYLMAVCANIFASILLGREASIFLYLKFIGP